MKRPTFFLAFFVASITLFAQQKLPYQNPKLPVEERVKDLIARMTLHEKIMQTQHIHGTNPKRSLLKLDTLYKGISYGCVEGLTHTAEDYAQSLITLQKYMLTKTRLGIPVMTCAEGLHGVVQDGCTIYPQALAMSSTFNPDLINKMTKAAALEAKAIGIYQVLSPVLDIARDTRWGRVEETYGEDPVLNGIMASAFINGFQSQNVVCTPKHFVAHGSPTGGINIASVSGGERDFRSIYLLPFEIAIKNTYPLSVMNSYNSYDGQPIASSHYYLTEVLRNQLGFKGYVYSDWDAVDMLRSYHKTAADKGEAAKQAIEAGIDVEASSDDYLDLEKMVSEGKVDIKTIDQAVSRILYVKFKSGLFEYEFPNMKKLKTAIHTKESIAIAREIASESIILLKNDNILPLNTEKYKSIAVLGPNAGNVQFGDYSWTRSNEFGVTPLQGIQSLVGKSVKVNYAAGCDVWSQKKEGIAEAVEAAKNSDVAVIFVGTQSASLGRDYKDATSGEGYDLSDLNLPGVQEDLIKAVKATGKPIIVVLVSGKPLSIPWVKDNANAILAQWYGGEQQGNAVADVLFGKVNPSGKLSISVPRSVGHLPCFYNYLPSDKGIYRERGTLDKPGRDYVFSSPDALWNFGYGLSYSNFEYEDATLSSAILTEKDTLNISVQVKNAGGMDGKEVVQVYVRDVVSSVVTPIHQLKAFKKILIKAGETSTVNLQLPISDLFLYNTNMKRVVEPGEFEIQIGSSSDDIKIKKMISVK